MVLKSRKERELAKFLARPVIAQLAPDDIEEFDELAEDFFDDPKLEGDRTLGAGLDLLPELVVILMFVSATLEALLVRSGSESARSLLERLNKAVVHRQATAQTPWFYSEDLAAAFQSASRKTPQISEGTRHILEQTIRKLLPVRVKILYLGASPTPGQRVSADRELREIEAVLRESSLRERISLRSVLAVTADEFQRSLLATSPQVLHFSGHGHRASSPVQEPTSGQRDVLSGGIVIEEPTGSPKYVQSDNLIELLDLFKSDLRLVVLNACHTEAHAKEIAAVVDATIGMAGAISDLAAQSFSRALYRALAHGVDLQRAFDLGCNQIRADGYATWAGVPRLFARREAARDIVLVEAVGEPASA